MTTRQRAIAGAAFGLVAILAAVLLVLKALGA